MFLGSSPISRLEVSLTGCSMPRLVKELPVYEEWKDAGRTFAERKLMTEVEKRRERDQEGYRPCKRGFYSAAE